MIPRPTTSTLFPYTTLFRSVDPVSGELVIWVSGQWPHTTRTLASQMLNLSEEFIRVITPDVGGGFGVKERSEEHTSELQSQSNLVCRLLLEKKTQEKSAVDT